MLSSDFYEGCGRPHLETTQVDPDFDIGIQLYTHSNIYVNSVNNSCSSDIDGAAKIASVYGTMCTGHS